MMQPPKSKSRSVSSSTSHRIDVIVFVVVNVVNVVNIVNIVNVVNVVVGQLESRFVVVKIVFHNRREGKNFPL